MAVRLQRAARAKVAPEIARDVLRLAIEQPAFGQDWVASRLSSRPRQFGGHHRSRGNATGRCGARHRPVRAVESRPATPSRGRTRRYHHDFQRCDAVDVGKRRALQHGQSSAGGTRSHHRKRGTQARCSLQHRRSQPDRYRHGTEAFQGARHGGHPRPRKTYFLISCLSPFGTRQRYPPTCRYALGWPASQPCSSVGSGLTRTSIFPKLSPRSISAKADGMISKPWRMSSRYLIFPAATRGAT
jgi:hypothetical protein